MNFMGFIEVVADAEEVDKAGNIGQGLLATQVLKILGRNVR